MRESQTGIGKWFDICNLYFWLCLGANTTNGNESATQPPAPLNVTTASTTQSPPHTSSVGTPNVTFSDFDADGDNVTNPGNANVTEDAHRYYNR